MTLRFIVATAVVVCGVPEVLAAQADDTLDLRRAVVLARSANPMLAARAAESRAANARIGSSGAWPDPTLSLGAMNYMLPDLSPRGDPMTMNQVTLMQVVPVNGALGLRRDAARADSTRYVHLAQAAALEVEAAVRGRYWALYHDDRALEIMARRRTVLLDISTVATTMYATGAAVQADALRAQVAVTRLDQEIAEMRLRRYTAAAELNALLGRSGAAPVVLASAGGTEHAALLHTLDMPEPPSLDSLTAFADRHSPEILGGSAAVGSADANAAAAGRVLIPDLGLGVAYGQRTGSNDMVSLMVSVSVPLFASSRRQRDEANAMREAASLDLDAVRVRVHAALATAREEAMTARRLVALYAQTLVPQAEATYQAALAAYRVGRVDFATLLDAQTALLEYEHDLHNYEAMYGTAVAEIDRLIGRSIVAGVAAGGDN